MKDHSIESFQLSLYFVLCKVLGPYEDSCIYNNKVTNRNRDPTRGGSTLNAKAGRPLVGRVTDYAPYPLRGHC